MHVFEKEKSIQFTAKLVDNNGLIQKGGDQFLTLDIPYSGCLRSQSV